jgi:hypothetical protein
MCGFKRGIDEKDRLISPYYRKIMRHHLLLAGAKSAKKELTRWGVYSELIQKEVS